MDPSEIAIWQVCRSGLTEGTNDNRSLCRSPHTWLIMRLRPGLAANAESVLQAVTPETDSFIFYKMHLLLLGKDNLFTSVTVCHFAIICKLHLLLINYLHFIWSIWVCARSTSADFKRPNTVAFHIRNVTTI